jgi:hypothetical protein
MSCLPIAVPTFSHTDTGLSIAVPVFCPGLVQLEFGAASTMKQVACRHKTTVRGQVFICKEYGVAYPEGFQWCHDLTHHCC